VLGHFVDAVDEHKRPHLAELALDGIHEHQRESREGCHAAGDVGDDHQFGFGGPRKLELWFGRHPAVAQRVSHGVAEVERAAPAVTTLSCESRGELAREREQRLLQRLHLFAAGVHEFHVFRQRLAESLRHRFSPAVGDEPATNLGFYFFLELLDALLVFVFHQALLEVGRLALR